MKINKFFGIAILLASAVGLPSCQADMDAPELQTPESTLTPNHTILEIKTLFENASNTKIGQYFDEEKGDSVHYIIRGRVISSDAAGNIYKSLVIQDETAALALSINQSSMYNEYRLGQEMVVDLTGLYIGYYRGLQQIGYPGEDYNGTPQLGFMSFDYWLSNAQYNGIPNPDFAAIRFNGTSTTAPDNQAYMLAFNNFGELGNGSLLQLQSQLVEFRNVSFQIKEGEENYAPYQESVNRTLVDANGQTLTVRNSGYSNFYNELLPEGRGNVRGILSYYGDSWQLLLRDDTDVMITKKGIDQENAFSVADLLSGEFDGLSGYAKGYIVGSVKAGVTTATSADDVIFGANAEIDNNILIADNAAETDWTKCAIIQLPQNTLLRSYTNLLDNPAMVGKLIELNATVGSYLGIYGMVDCRGTKKDFTIDGNAPADGTEAPAPAGSGTEADPYNVSYVMQTSSNETDVWVEGYVAGYVAKGDYLEDNCEFSSTGVSGSSNWLNQSNIILSANAPAKCGFNNSIPVQLTSSSRPTLGLKDNPSVYGKKVKVKCQISEYLGTRGIKKITEVVVL